MGVSPFFILVALFPSFPKIGCFISSWTHFCFLPFLLISLNTCPYPQQSSCFSSQRRQCKGISISIPSRAKQPCYVDCCSDTHPVIERSMARANFRDWGFHLCPPGMKLSVIKKMCMPSIFRFNSRPTNFRPRIISTGNFWCFGGSVFLCLLEDGDVLRGLGKTPFATWGCHLLSPHDFPSLLNDWPQGTPQQNDNTQTTFDLRRSVSIVAPREMKPSMWWMVVTRAEHQYLFNSTTWWC